MADNVIPLILHGVPVRPFDVSPAVTGASSVFALPAIAGSLQWQTFFGTNPSAVQIDLEFSLDNIHWDAVDSSTVLAGEIRTFATVGGAFVRANVIAITGGAGVSLMILCQRL